MPRKSSGGRPSSVYGQDEGISAIAELFQRLKRDAPFTPYILIIVGSSFIYLLIFTLPFLLPQTYNIIPPVDYTKLTNYSGSGFLTFVLGIAALFALYIWAIRLAWPVRARATTEPRNFSLRSIFFSSAIFALILLFAYPLTAIDLFIYAIRSRGWALYGLPPLSTPPERLPPSDPWLGLAGEWVDAPSPYGPLWEWVSLGAFYAGQGNFLSHLFMLKLIGLLAYLGCIWLIYRIIKKLQPDYAPVGALAFAWNPLVLFESVQNAHNDILMVLFLLAAIWVLVRSPTGSRHRDVSAREISRHLIFCVLLALSVLVKFVTILIGPFFLIAMAMRYATWQRRTVALAGYSLLVGGLAAALLAPVWPGWDNWAVLQAGSGAGRSLLALLILGLRRFTGTNTAFDLSRSFILLVFGAIYFYHLWQLFAASAAANSTQTGGAHWLEPPIRRSFLVMFWYVLLAVPVFHAWYLLWFAPLACLTLPQQPPLKATIVFSITALLVIPYFETIRVWYPLLLDNHFLGHLIGVPLLILPPAVTLLWPTSPTESSGVLSERSGIN